MDQDNEGSNYKNYFSQADNYHISNYKKEIKGLQGFENEFYLDLESELSLDLFAKYDVFLIILHLNIFMNFVKLSLIRANK